MFLVGADAVWQLDIAWFVCSSIANSLLGSPRPREEDLRCGPLPGDRSVCVGVRHELGVLVFRILIFQGRISWFCLDSVGCQAQSGHRPVERDCDPLIVKLVKLSQVIDAWNEIVTRGACSKVPASQAAAPWGPLPSSSPCGREARPALIASERHSGCAAPPRTNRSKHGRKQRGGS